MAVIKHIASKNADYGESERYLIFQHNEYTQKPILDDEGHMILREEYYQALVCTHTDGHNESGNIHVHIVINSLRKYDVPQEPYMEFDCESKAGYKHHLSTAYLAHLKQDVMDMCQKEGLHQVDLLSPAERKITEKEYWAQRRGQETLDKLNQKMLEDGITPKETRYQTEKQFLRDAIDDAASTAKSPEEFAQILDKKYHIIFKISRNRYSYLHPGKKNISLDEISEHDMKRIFYYRHLRKMKNHSLIGK